MKPISLLDSGDVLCGLCSQPKDAEEPKLRDGVVIDLDDNETPLCWKHFQGIVRMRRQAALKRQAVNASRGNGHAVAT